MYMYHLPTCQENKCLDYHKAVTSRQVLPPPLAPSQIQNSSLQSKAAVLVALRPFVNKSEQELNRRAKFLKQIQSIQFEFPAWVNDLNQLGVRAKGLRVSYQGEAATTGNGGWNCTPTMLRCVLEMNDALTPSCSITGHKQPTKELALESAVVELGSHLRRLNLTNNDKQTSAATKFLANSIVKLHILK